MCVCVCVCVCVSEGGGGGKRHVRLTAQIYTWVPLDRTHKDSSDTAPSSCACSDS